MEFFEFVQSMDEMILEFFRDSICSPALDGFMKVITLLGDHGIFAIILSLVLLCFKRTRKVGLTLGISLFIMLILNNYIIKPLVARPRPYINDPNIKIIISPPSGFSFPSGHAASLFTVSTVLTKYNKWCAFSFILSFLVGLSRIYLQVHYPSDVLAGAILGVIYGIVGIILFTILFKIYQKHFEEKVNNFIKSKILKKG